MLLHANQIDSIPKTARAAIDPTIDRLLKEPRKKFSI